MRVIELWEFYTSRSVTRRVFIFTDYTSLLTLSFLPRRPQKTFGKGWPNTTRRSSRSQQWVRAQKGNLVPVNMGN